MEAKILRIHAGNFNIGVVWGRFGMGTFCLPYVSLLPFVSHPFLFSDNLGMSPFASLLSQVTIITQPDRGIGT